MHHAGGDALQRRLAALLEGTVHGGRHLIPEFLGRLGDQFQRLAVVRVQADLVAAVEVLVGGVGRLVTFGHGPPPAVAPEARWAASVSSRYPMHPRRGSGAPPVRGRYRAPPATGALGAPPATGPCTRCATRVGRGRRRRWRSRSWIAEARCGECDARTTRACPG